eukprot:scaffold32820_cov62-Isochrysis_galbana.AAC.1
MGYDWLTSKCGTGPAAARIAEVQTLLTFKRTAERSLVHAYWGKCAMATRAKPTRPLDAFEPLALPAGLR